MNGRSLKLTPSPFRSPACSGLHGVPLWIRQNALMRSFQGSVLKPERTNVCGRTKALGPHPASSFLIPPITFGPNTPTRVLVKPSVAVQQEYEELSFARV